VAYTPAFVHTVAFGIADGFCFLLLLPQLLFSAAYRGFIRICQNGY